MPLLLLLAAPFATAASPRLAFTRTIPARHTLGERALIVYAIGDNSGLETFVETLVEHGSRDELPQLESLTERRQYFLHDPIDEKTLHTLQHRHPADAYLGVRTFHCSAVPKRGAGSAVDADGKHVDVTVEWVEARCSGTLDAASGVDGKHLFTLHVQGSASSAHVTELTNDEAQSAMQLAAHYAAIHAAEEFTPRIVRETVELDEEAPSFDEVMPMIDAGRLDDARAIWEAAVGQHHKSAPLQFDLAAVCEALGDTDAARRHYQAAISLAPHEKRYSAALILLDRRSPATRTYTAPAP